ncbi:alpha/beta hydrolase [Aureimonas psammosilenae]|uniref:alpha/beta hydrolase n=1 Tax=Aureimonas psammosilenae TaxID=2495496 RepID=UPI0012604C44|nr:alpha/beta hydrolase-fold protein [Aureimonas psammosilenae]
MLLPGTRAYDLPSAGNGETYRIFVHVPSTPAPKDGWPLLAIVDGNAMIGLAVETSRVQSRYPASTDVEPGVIVAVGYPTDEPYDPLRRSFDLSPPPGRTYPPFTEGGPVVRTGGAVAFQRFIEDEVLPFVDRLARIDPARRTLFGHSFGGLFALWVMFSGSAAFRRFVAASPTIYWEDGLLLDAERLYAPPGDDAPVIVHLSAGEHEGDALAPFQYGREDSQKRLEKAAEARTLRLAREMAARLDALPGVSSRFEVFGGETHMSVLAAATSRAVNVAFAIKRP